MVGARVARPSMWGQGRALVGRIRRFVDKKRRLVVRESTVVGKGFSRCVTGQRLPSVSFIHSFRGREPKRSIRENGLLAIHVASRRCNKQWRERAQSKRRADRPCAVLACRRRECQNGFGGSCGPRPGPEAGISVHTTSFEGALPFIGRALRDPVRERRPRFYEEAMSDAKRRFYAETDVFVFRMEQTDIGIAIGHPSDWATYYMRTRRRFFPRLAVAASSVRSTRAWLELVRAVGAERMEMDASPGNAAMTSMLFRNGFCRHGVVEHRSVGHAASLHEVPNARTGTRVRQAVSGHPCVTPG